MASLCVPALSFLCFQVQCPVVLSTAWLTMLHHFLEKHMAPLQTTPGLYSSRGKKFGKKSSLISLQ